MSRRRYLIGNTSPANSTTRTDDRSCLSSPPRVSMSTSELGVQYHTLRRSCAQWIATAAGNDAMRGLTG